jgi:hypothetical protein
MIVPAERRAQAGCGEKALQNCLFQASPVGSRQSSDITGGKANPGEAVGEFTPAALPASLGDLIATSVPAEPKRRPAPIV